MKFLHRFSNRVKTSKKGLINIKNNDQKWCHVRHIDPLNEHPEIITKIDREINLNLVILSL